MSGEKLTRRCTLTLGETGSKQTRNLLDKSLRGQESVVFLRELLDELLVLVEPWDIISHQRPRLPDRHALLQVVNGHVLEVDLLGTVDVVRVGQNADGHARARDVREPAPPRVSTSRRHEKYAAGRRT